MRTAESNLDATTFLDFSTLLQLCQVQKGTKCSPSEKAHEKGLLEGTAYNVAIASIARKALPPQA